MGSIQFISGANYTGSSGTLPFHSTGTNAAIGTISDGEGDATFETTDTLTVTIPPSDVYSATYDGSIDIDLTAGGTMSLPVIVIPSIGFTIIPIPTTMNLSDFSFPASVNLAALDPSPYPACFIEGTLIATGDGLRRVEKLKIGDRITTASGGEVAVKWIGRQSIFTRFTPADRLMPVRFAAGSLEAGVPHKDLTVTADHAVLIDGVLCNAGALVNGTTITRVPLAEMGERYSVYHVETDAHEIILANGAPAETFIDNVSRQAFDNYAEFEALYGDTPEMEELPLPRALSARQVPNSIRGKLGLLAAA